MGRSKFLYSVVTYSNNYLYKIKVSLIGIINPKWKGGKTYKEM